MSGSYCWVFGKTKGDGPMKEVEVSLSHEHLHSHLYDLFVVDELRIAYF